MLTVGSVEAARRTIARKLTKKVPFFVRIHPRHPLGAKSKGARMGGSKGSFKEWVYVVRPGTVLFELDARKIPQIWLKSEYNKKRVPEALESCRYVLKIPVRVRYF